MRLRFSLRSDNAFKWTQAVEVSDEPIASEVDAMQRQHDLRVLSEEKENLEKQWRESGGRFKVRRKTLSRLTRAMDILKQHLAVWQVQDQ